MRTASLIVTLGWLLPLMPKQDYSKLRRDGENTDGTSGIKDSATLAAMRKVPRHTFVPTDQVAMLMMIAHCQLVTGKPYRNLISWLI